MTTMTVSSSQLSCANITILNDDIVEECEAFFVAFEVDPNFSGVAAIPKEVDKSVILIIDDLTDSKWDVWKVDLPLSRLHAHVCNVHFAV